MTEQNKIHYATIGFVVGAVTAIIIFVIGGLLHIIK